MIPSDGTGEKQCHDPSAATAEVSDNSASNNAKSRKARAKRAKAKEAKKKKASLERNSSHEASAQIPHRFGHRSVTPDYQPPSSEPESGEWQVVKHRMEPQGPRAIDRPVTTVNPDAKVYDVNLAVKFYSRNLESLKIVTRGIPPVQDKRVVKSGDFYDRAGKTAKKLYKLELCRGEPITTALYTNCLAYVEAFKSLCAEIPATDPQLEKLNKQLYVHRCLAKAYRLHLRQYLNAICWKLDNNHYPLKILDRLKRLLNSFAVLQDPDEKWFTHPSSASATKSGDGIFRGKVSDEFHKLVSYCVLNAARKQFEYAEYLVTLPCHDIRTKAIEELEAILQKSHPFRQEHFITTSVHKKFAERLTRLKQQHETQPVMKGAFAKAIASKNYKRVVDELNKDASQDWRAWHLVTVILNGAIETTIESLSSDSKQLRAIELNPLLQLCGTLIDTFIAFKSVLQKNYELHDQMHRLFTKTIASAVEKAEQNDIILSPDFYEAVNFLYQNRLVARWLFDFANTYKKQTSQQAASAQYYHDDYENELSATESQGYPEWALDDVLPQGSSHSTDSSHSSRSHQTGVFSLVTTPEHSAASPVHSRPATPDPVQQSNETESDTKNSAGSMKFTNTDSPACSVSEQEPVNVPMLTTDVQQTTGHKPEKALEPEPATTNQQERNRSENIKVKEMSVEETCSEDKSSEDKSSEAITSKPLNKALPWKEAPLQKEHQFVEASEQQTLAEDEWPDIAASRLPVKPKTSSVAEAMPSLISEPYVAGKPLPNPIAPPPGFKARPAVTFDQVFVTTYEPHIQHKKNQKRKTLTNQESFQPVLERLTKNPVLQKQVVQGPTMRDVVIPPAMLKKHSVMTPGLYMHHPVPSGLHMQHQPMPPGLHMQHPVPSGLHMQHQPIPPGLHMQHAMPHLHHQNPQPIPYTQQTLIPIPGAQNPMTMRPEIMYPMEYQAPCSPQLDDYNSPSFPQGMTRDPMSIINPVVMKTVDDICNTLTAMKRVGYQHKCTVISSLLMDLGLLLDQAADQLSSDINFSKIMQLLTIDARHLNNLCEIINKPFDTLRSTLLHQVRMDEHWYLRCVQFNLTIRMRNLLGLPRETTLQIFTVE